MTQDPKIFCAVDTADLQRALQLAREVGPVTGALKLGLEFVNSFGPQGVEEVMNACPEAQIFMDLKLHDIPNTVAAAVHSLCTNLNPAYLNVHTSGGSAMMARAMAACSEAGGQTKLLGVTVLTSMDEEALKETGLKVPVADQVTQLAQLAQSAGLDGVVCSGHESEVLRALCGPDFILMVPGVRPEHDARDDQKRVMTPKQALQKGATHLVIGRPITQNPSPAAAAQAILDEIGT